MSVTERVMVAGAWAVDLAPETPGQLMEQIALSRAGFAQIEILPAHLDPREHSDETLLGLARYTGLYRSQEGTYRLSGPGLPVLLGDEEGKADIAETAISTPNGWLSQWVPALRPITLRSGTVTSPGGAYTGTFRLKNRKEAFEILNDAFGVEWRIRPTLHLDVGPPSALYGSVPQLLILRNAGSGGRDLSPLPAAPTSVQTLTGVVVEDADWDEDLENYTTKTIYATGEEGAEVLTTATTPDADIPYGRGIDSGPVIWDRLISASTDNGSTPQQMADALLARYTGIRRELRVSGGQLDAAQLPQVGAPVWLYAPPTVMDTASPIQFRGRTVWPITSRLLGMTWPITRGCGVYLRVWRSPQVLPVWHDLTDYVLWEDGDLQLEVGALPRGSVS